MKKLTTVLLVLLLACSLFAQGGKEAQTQTTDDGVTMRLLTDATGIDDKSFNAAAWRGILSFYGDPDQKERGTAYDVVTAQTQDQYIPNIRQAAEGGYDLICTTGFTFADALIETAPQYPDQNFCIVDVDWVNQPNVMEFIFSEEEGSYLVGLAAAYQAQKDGIRNPKFGFIGGVPGSTITKFEMGYIQGVKAVFPDAEIVDFYANDWGKPELAKAQAKNWFDNGVYCIFSAAGGTGGGTIAQAKEYRSQGKNVWAIGVDSDQYEDGLYADGKSAVLTSMIKKVELATEMALNACKDGTFKGGVVRLGLKDGGVGYSKANAELSDDVKTLIDNVAKDIAEGKFVIFGTYAETKTAGIAPANLGAIDD